MIADHYWHFAELCELLVSGNTVEEAARRLDIAVDTARVHLRSVVSKVGGHRQAELIAKVLATPVSLRHQNREGGAAVQAANGVALPRD